MSRLWATLTILLSLAPPATVAATDVNQNAALACAALASTLPKLVSLPHTPSYTDHNEYWSSRQTEVHPACFIAPTNTQQVAQAIALLTFHNTPFTVKGGGHTAFAGGSNIGSNGVTVDLAALGDITLSADRRTVSVGAGARWINVSEALDPLGIAVAGGRSDTVGVAGLTLGGGISYFSGSRGWACDNVRAYEVVLASGQVVCATPGENADLYWALRGGGGSNFGVVTRFDLVAFEQGDLWASSLVYPGAANTTLIPLVHDLLVKGLVSDPAAHTYFVMAYVAELGGFVALTDQFHATPPAKGLAPPSVFAAFPAAGLTPLVNNTRLSNTSQLLRDIDEPDGERQTWWDTTVAATATPDLLLDIVPLFEEHANRLLAAAAADNSSVTPYLAYQAISTNIMQAMEVNGGNALGLRPEDGPIMIVQAPVTWTSAALDDLVESSARELISKVDALAAARNARSKNGYIYMNYAGKTQNVFAGYGAENLARLKSVAGKYDPEGKLRNLWRGYFKL